VVGFAVRCADQEGRGCSISGKKRVYCVRVLAGGRRLEGWKRTRLLSKEDGVFVGACCCSKELSELGKELGTACVSWLWNATGGEWYLVVREADLRHGRGGVVVLRLGGWN